MRRAVTVFVLFLISSAAAGAARVVTVEELEAIVAEAHAQHRSDAELAQQLSAVELSERLIDLRYARLSALLEPGSQAAEALELVADQSVFFPPAHNEITDTSVPDAAAVQKIVAAVSDYVARYLHDAPNLLATRTTTNYTGGGYAGKKGQWIAHPGLNKGAVTSTEISSLNDRIVLKAKEHRQKQDVLRSVGEFGKLFSTVLSDSSHSGGIFWEYWEPSATGQLAVLGFEVSQAASHYAVVEARGGIFPAYHGLLWVDPVSGAITSLLIQSDPFALMSSEDFATMVRYGPVQIDGRRFICPVRSVAIEKPVVALSDKGDGVWLNEVTFTHYHRYGSDAVILPAPDRTPR